MGIIENILIISSFKLMIIASKAAIYQFQLSLPRFKDHITFETILSNPVYTAILPGGFLSITGTELYS